MTQPIISRFTVDDGVNEKVYIYIDRDADPGIRSYVLDPDGTLDGLRALVAAAEQLESVK